MGLQLWLDFHSGWYFRKQTGTHSNPNLFGIQTQTLKLLLSHMCLLGSCIIWTLHCFMSSWWSQRSFVSVYSSRCTCSKLLWHYWPSIWMFAGSENMSWDIQKRCSFSISFLGMLFHRRSTWEAIGDFIVPSSKKPRYHKFFPSEAHWSQEEGLLGVERRKVQERGLWCRIQA